MKLELYFSDKGFFIPIMIVIGILVFLILVLIGISLVFSITLQKKMFNYHQNETDNPCYLSYPLYEKDIDRSKIEIKLNKKDTVRGYIYTKKYFENFKGFIILSPGYGGTHLQYLLDINYLCELGYKVLAYDHIGTGESSGNSMVDLAKGRETNLSVINYIVDNNINNGLKIVLYGHSWGGYSVVAGCNEKVSAIISRSGFDSPMQIMSHNLKQINKKFGFFIPGAKLYYLFFHGNRSFKRSYDNYHSLKKKIPLLLIHAQDDDVVPYNLSIANVFKEQNVENISYCITKVGHHNSILSEKGYQAHLKMKKEYEEDKNNLYDENNNFKYNLRETYTLNSYVKKSIEVFLDMNIVQNQKDEEE